VEPITPARSPRRRYFVIKDRGSLILLLAENIKIQMQLHFVYSEFCSSSYDSVQCR
jgi:hypothetical protein